MTKLLFVSVPVALALAPPEVSAWGRNGHQVVANLVQSRLSLAARMGVAANPPVLRLQLLRAGVHLAAFLNAIVEQAATRRTP
jgi:hypothetical protein